MLAEHIAHLFIRDPVSLFSEKIYIEDDGETDHFEVSFHSSLLGELLKCVMVCQENRWVLRR